MVLDNHVQSFVQDFASTQTCGTSVDPPNGWTISSGGTNNRWVLGNILSPCPGCPGTTIPFQPGTLPGSTGFAHIYSYNAWIGPNSCNSPYYSPTQTSTSTLTSPVYNTTSLDLVKLSFWYVSDGELDKDFGIVEYSYDGTNWSSLVSGSIPTRLQGTSNWTQAISNSEAVLSNRPAVWFRFTWQNDGSGGTGRPLAIDNFRILSAPPTPVSLLTWNGSSSTDWHTAANWTPAQIPTRCTDVIIGTSTQYPIIASGSDASCRTLTINPSCTLTNNTSSSGAFNIYGNIYLDDESVLSNPAGLKAIELYSPAGTIYSGLDANISSARLALQTGSAYQLNSNLSVNSVAIRAGASLQAAANRELTVFGFHQLGNFGLGGAGSLLQIMGVNNGYASLDNATPTTNPIFSTATLSLAALSEVHYLGGTLGLNQNIKSITYPLLVVAGGAGSRATLGSGTAFAASRLWLYNTEESGIIEQDNDLAISGNAFIGTNPSNSANFGQKLNIELNARLIGSGGSWNMGTQSHYLKVNYTHATNAFVSGFASHVFYGTAELAGTVVGVRQRIVSNAIFDNLLINRTANHAELLGNISIVNQLSLQSGNLISATSDTVRINNFTSSSVVFNTLSGSCVQGNLRRWTSTGIDYFFPVGTATNRQTAFINLNSISGGLNQISARFVATSPTTDSYNGAAGSSSLTNFWDNGANFNAIRPNGYWNIQPIRGSAIYEMRLWPQPLGASGSDFMQVAALGIAANAYTFVRRTSSSPSIWQKVGNISNPNTAQMNNGVFADNSVRRTGLTGFSNFALVGGTPTTGPLPVELLFFKGRRIDAQTNILEWQTASEKDNEGFEILAGQKSESLKPIGFVKSNTAQINIRKYSFKHQSQIDTYYQLIQQDLDGSKNYGPIILIRAEQQVKVALYPNPATKELFVDAPINSRFELHDALGRLVMQGLITQKYQMRFALPSALASGIYIAHIYTDNKLELTEKIMIKMTRK